MAEDVPVSMPLKNSTWPSINAFKLATYRAAMQQKIWLGVRKSAYNNVTLGCTLLGYGGRDSGPPCSYHLFLSADPTGEDQAGFRVSTACEEHSHKVTEEHWARGKPWMERRIAKAMEDEALEERDVVNKRARVTKEEERDSEEEVGDSESDLSQLDSESEAEGGEADGVASWETSDVTSAAWRYPSAVAVERAVRSLLALGPVPFPTPLSSFTTATSRELFIVLYAASRQRDFAVYRKSDGASLKRARLCCTKSHGRIPVNQRCRFEVVIEEVEGRWTVVAWNSHHSHAVKGEDGEVIAPQRRERAGEEEEDDELGKDDAESEEANSSDDYENAALPRKNKQRLRAPTLPDSPDLPLGRLGATKTAISDLAAAGPLSIPSPTSNFTFPSAAALRVHLCAAAKQRDFTLYVRGNQSATSFVLKCKLGHSRFGKDLCPYEVHAGCAARADGPWRVTLVAGEHNHQVLSEADWKATTGKGKRKERQHDREGGFIEAEKRVRSASDDDVKPSKKNLVNGVMSRHSFPFPSSRNLATSFPRASTAASTSPSTFRSGATAKHHSALPNITGSMLPTPRSSVTPSDTFASVHKASSFLPTLTAFLSFLSPTLVPFAPSLHDAGLDSMETLINVAYAGEAAVERALLEWESESLQRMPALQRVLFKKGLRRAADAGLAEG